MADEKNNLFNDFGFDLGDDIFGTDGTNEPEEPAAADPAEEETAEELPEEFNADFDFSGEDSDSLDALFGGNGPTPVEEPEPEKSAAPAKKEETAASEPEPVEAEETPNAVTIAAMKETEEQVEAETEQEPEVAVEEKPKKKITRRRHKNKAAAEEAKEEAPAEVEEAPKAEAPDPTHENMNGNTIDITKNSDRIIAALDLYPAISEEFVASQKTIQEKMNKIVITPKMDAANIDIMLCKIDEVVNIIDMNLPSAKSIYVNLSNRDDGVLARAITRGSILDTPYGNKNEVARRANGNYYAEHYKMNGEEVNLFTLVAAARDAYDFYDSALQQAESKRRILKSKADAWNALAMRTK